MWPIMLPPSTLNKSKKVLDASTFCAQGRGVESMKKWRRHH